LTDAKLGMWSHWGPQSVPMAGDWYARHMYVEGHKQYLYHLRHYGHPSKFGYKDLVKLWKAENFDPDALMDKYHKAGARYFIGQAMHHDHFFNFPSKLNRFNSTQVGPMKDISGLWKSAADNMKMNFGFTEHLGATFSWWGVNKGADRYGAYAGVPYDGTDPEYKDFYFENTEHLDPNNRSWYTSNEKYHDYWLAVMKELIDLYTPDMLYSDGPLPFGDREGNAPESAYRHGLEAVAYLHNKSAEKYGESRAAYTQKCRNERIYKVGLLDIEKSQLPGILDNVWQTDTCIGNWFYDATQPFKKPGHIIEMLVDIISKNGVMLLNILQLPDGSIDDEAEYILKEMAAWYAACGEGVYGTRPWRTFSEGPSGVAIEGFTEVSVNWTSGDYRFVKKGNVLYAFMMRAPENRAAVVKSLADGNEIAKSVRLLGHGEVEFAQNYGILTVKLPPKMPTAYTNCLAIELK